MKKEKKAKTVSMTVPKNAAFPTVFAFNVWGVETVDMGILVHCGLRTAGGLIDSFMILIEPMTVLANQESWAEFLVKVGGPPDDYESAAFRCVSKMGGAPISRVNAVMWNRLGDSGEIRCFCGSLGDITDSMKTGEAVVAHPVALLQCSLKVQAGLMAQVLQQSAPHED